MDRQKFESILAVGETVAVEFKRCGNGLEHDVYESVCSFLNRFGGDIFLGIEDDRTVCGLPDIAVNDMIKNFIKVLGNPNMFSPTVHLTPERMEYCGKVLIHIYVPPSAEVHSYKRVIYDRVDDADVKVTATSQIAEMYIRKQSIFTEKKIFKYIGLEDLRLDLLPRVKQMAINHAGGSHPWENMGDEELLRSAGLYGMDRVTGEKGFNLAGVMLLGKDDLILDVCPAYVTDALLRRINKDRYDDREIIRTNLIESFDLLLEFAKKHLPDKFFIEDTARKSLRNLIAREMLVNTLIHREFTSTYTAKFVIEKERMYVENANRASRCGNITPENLEPNPKNPVIASFFRNIGWSDKLGSGVRNLFKYSVLYSGREPEFIEDDIFRIIVPLDEAYSGEKGKYSGITNRSNDKNVKGIDKSKKSSDKTVKNVDKYQESSDKKQKSVDKSLNGMDKQNENSDKIYNNGNALLMVELKPGGLSERTIKRLAKYAEMVNTLLEEQESITNADIRKATGLSSSAVRKILKDLVDCGVLVSEGEKKSRKYMRA